MEEESPANTSPNLRNPSLCDECGSNPWKYRCPGCSIRSCSLPCVNSHKKRISCTGKRRRTDSVPLSQFDDNVLLADYMFLEETKRVADAARRMIGGFRCYFGFKLPIKLLMLRNAARRRRIQLWFFPSGMSKRETNQSRYDPRKNTIFWTLELRFHGTGISLVHHGVDEHESLLSIFAKHLSPGPWNHNLKSFCNVQLDDLNIFLHKNPKNSKSLLRKLDIKASIGSQLANILILEYPVIFVYLPSHDIDFEFEIVRTSSLKNIVPSTSDGIPIQNGTLYRVEEVEESDLPSDTRVTDLMDSMKSAANSINLPEDTNVVSNPNVTKDVSNANNAVNFTDKQINVATSVGFNFQISGESQRTLATNSPDSGDPGFYFEQELTNVFSDLMGGMNPDDFLCLDGVYDDSFDLREARWCDMEEKVRVDELDEVREVAFEMKKGDDLGEHDLKDELVGLEERHDNVLKENINDLEEGREDSFPSGRILFGGMEIEEGEIPCFL